MISGPVTAINQNPGVRARITRKGLDYGTQPYSIDVASFVSDPGPA